jgi:2',3'-cyclic-nucleotide 2'-phosphodiesterase (5'-nucleotidase family)
MKKKKPSTPPPAGKKKVRKPRPRKVPAEVSAARSRVAWELRVIYGMTFADITKKLNELFPSYKLKSEHQAVEKMIKQAEQEYIDVHKSEVERIKAETGASLDFVRREAASAWETSQDLLRVIKKKEDQTVEQILKAQTGDSSYLKLIKDASIEKAKLYGAVAPKKHEVLGKNIDLGKLSDEQLQRIANGEDPVMVLSNA